MSMLLEDSFTLHILWYWLVFSMVHMNKLGLIEILLYFYTSPNGNIYQSSRTTPSKKRNWKDGCNFSLTYYYPSILYLLYLFYFHTSIGGIKKMPMSTSNHSNSPSHSLTFWFNFFFTHLRIHSPSHTQTYSFTHTNTHSLIFLLTNLLIHSLTDLFFHSLTHSLTFSFITHTTL